MIVDNFDIMYSLSMCVGVVCALDFYDFFIPFSILGMWILNDQVFANWIKLNMSIG